MIQHEAVGVVDDLRLVAELDRPPQASLADREGVRIVQGRHPVGAVLDLAGQAVPGLSDDLFGQTSDPVDLFERPAHPAA